MRLIKMLGLAVVAALAAMAFVGAGAASADSLCEMNVNHQTGTCPDPLLKDKPILGLTLGGTPAILLAGATKVTCHSTFLGLVGSNEGAHVGLWGLVDSLTFTACSGSCTGADGLNEPYLLLGNALELHALVSDDGAGVPETLLTGCSFGDCKYKLEVIPTLLDVLSDTLVANEEKLKRTAGLCPLEAKFDATYLLTLEDVARTPVYLVSLP